MNSKDLNTKIEEALNDKNITNIMRKASGRFSKQLDSDDIYTCEINALWKSMLNFKPEKNTKFTTYLYNGVFIECLKQIKFLNKSSKSSYSLHNNIADERDQYLIVDLLDELQSDYEKELILDRMSRMTIKEMAQKHNVSRETIRKRIKKITNGFKKKFV
tara:strand:- start:1343 stop:1822 length:480 start_codon:yes stop_codon:yes gene_type:complete